MKNVNKSNLLLNLKKEKKCLVKLPVFFSICLCFCSFPVCLVIAKTDLNFLHEFHRYIEFEKIPDYGKMVLLGKVSNSSSVMPEGEKHWGCH